MFKLQFHSDEPEYFDNKPRKLMGKMLLIWGVLLVAGGVLIIYYPFLLQAMIAAMLILAGAVCLALAWYVHQMQKKARSFFERFFGGKG